MFRPPRVFAWRGPRRLVPAPAALLQVLLFGGADFVKTPDTSPLPFDVNLDLLKLGSGWRRGWRSEGPWLPTRGGTPAAAGAQLKTTSTTAAVVLEMDLGTAHDAATSAGDSGANETYEALLQFAAISQGNLNDNTISGLALHRAAAAAGSLDDAGAGADSKIDRIVIGTRNTQDWVVVTANGASRTITEIVAANANVASRAAAYLAYNIELGTLDVWLACLETVGGVQTEKVKNVLGITATLPGGLEAMSYLKGATSVAAQDEANAGYYRLTGIS